MHCGRRSPETARGESVADEIWARSSPTGDEVRHRVSVAGDRLFGSRLDARFDQLLDSRHRVSTAPVKEAFMSSPALDAPAFRIPTKEELGFDPQALRRKYDFERDKRLRPGGDASRSTIENGFTTCSTTAL
jgi:hypothetical protein